MSSSFQNYDLSSFLVGHYKGAYIDCFGTWDAAGFEEAYSGEWDGDEALAEDYIESTGMLSEMPDNLRGYFDTAAFTRDLMFDYSESGGHYFRNY